jgi:predicted transposase/invertase (TIGR01784 family)
MKEYANYRRAQDDRINRETNVKAAGKAEGETKKAREAAVAMLAEGLQVDMISRCTGLSVEDVEKLKNG